MDCFRCYRPLSICRVPNDSVAKLWNNHTVTLNWGGMRQHSWLRHSATSRKVAGLSPDEVDFFNLSNPSSRTMALGSTQPLTERSTRNLPGGKERPAHKADNLTAIFEPIV
jgi:hypothetical protein